MRPFPRQTYLVQADDLTVGLLDLAELGEEVPETALGNNGVGSEDTHAVELRGGLRVSGQMAPNDLVLLQATCWATESALSYGQFMQWLLFLDFRMSDRHDSVLCVHCLAFTLLRSCSCSASFSP